MGVIRDSQEFLRRLSMLYPFYYPHQGSNKKRDAHNTGIVTRAYTPLGKGRVRAWTLYTTYISSGTGNTQNNRQGRSPDIKLEDTTFPLADVPGTELEALQNWKNIRVREWRSSLAKDPVGMPELCPSTPNRPRVGVQRHTNPGHGAAGA